MINNVHYIGLHEKYPLFMSGFSETRISSGVLLVFEGKILRRNIWAYERKINMED